MRIQRKTERPRGNVRAELVRKGLHVAVGVATVLLLHAGILSTALIGLLTLLLAAAVLYNLKHEREFLRTVISLNRPDALVPGLDLLAYALGIFIAFIATLGIFLALLLFPRDIAYASILVLAFGDPLAHLVSRSFGATNTMVTRNSYWYGALAGTLAGTLAAWIYVHFLPALIASAAAMFVEAGELRIASHHIDDNLTIPLVAGLVLWVISLAFA